MNNAIVTATIDSRFEWACTNPSDIAEHIETLYSYGRLCRHITEFGVRGAVSTSAWLKSRPAHLVCYDINIPECLAELQRLSVEVGIDFRFVTQNTTTVEIEDTDLLFVDTTHNYDTVKSEIWENQKHVSKFIIFHDTELNAWSGENSGLGLKQVLIDFLLTYTHWRIDAHFTNCCGLTVLKREQ